MRIGTISVACFTTLLAVSTAFAQGDPQQRNRNRTGIDQPPPVQAEPAQAQPAEADQYQRARVFRSEPERSAHFRAGAVR